MTNASKWLISVLVFLLLLFGLTAVVQLPLLNGAIAPIGGLLCAIIIFHTIHQCKHKLFKLNYMFIGAAALTWAIADGFRYVAVNMLSSIPYHMIIGSAFALLYKLCLIAAMLVYAYKRLRKWDSYQLMLDGFIFSIATLWLLWALLYDKQVSQMHLMLDFGILSTISLGADIFLLILIGIWFLSVRENKMPLYLRVLITSVLSIPILDILHYNLSSRHLHIPDPLLGFIYLAVFSTMSITIKLYYQKFSFTYRHKTTDTNTGYRYKGLLLILCPILILVFKTLDAADIVLYASIILLHSVLSSFIYKAYEDKVRLSHEMIINKRLEQLVAAQTRSLKATNAALLERNADLKFVTEHDSLTGLINRSYFMEILETNISKASVKGTNVALMMWNINNFKGINDPYGHQIGDMILIQHTQRVQAVLGDNCTFARLGGDEFTICMQGVLKEEDVLLQAQKVVDTCKDPFHISGYTFNITIGIGIAMYPQCADDRSSLLRNADVSMLYAKQTKLPGSIATYMEINNAVSRKMLIANHLKTANYQKDLALHFQPQFRIKDQKLIGMEALLRWNCPGIGPVSPAEFIPIAEEENLIIPIGNWVIENAVAQIAKWNRKNHTNLRMGINISPMQIDQSATFEILGATIKKYHSLFRWIDIEVTEGVALDFENSAGNIKEYFKTRQLSVSIDDFGTGYSSLGYLAILSFDRLKIAKPLIDEITSDDSKRKIVSSIILLAQSLDLKTIAEGVETKDQFDLLAELGCDQIQGYYLGKPVPAKAFEEKFLQNISE